MTDPLPARARRLWTELAGTPVTFGGSGIDVAVSATSALCPPGWVGIVALGHAVIATVPERAQVDVVRQALGGLSAAAATDPAVMRDRLPVAEILGPATLAYCDADRFRPAGPAGVASGPDELTALVAGVPAEEADEADLADITSSAFVVRDGARVVAAAGYRVWPCDTAHLSVLTAPEHRGRGLARIAAGAAVADALAAGLLPQWRARPEASRRVARALGFQELGAQLSIRLRAGPRGSAG
jgi:GNAT superfamily N-acetyltransferase